MGNVDFAASRFQTVRGKKQQWRERGKDRRALSCRILLDAGRLRVLSGGNRLPQPLQLFVKFPNDRRLSDLPDSLSARTRPAAGFVPDVAEEVRKAPLEEQAEQARNERALRQFH